MFSQLVSGTKILAKLSTPRRFPFNFERQIWMGPGAKKPYVFVTHTRTDVLENVPSAREDYAVDIEEVQNKAAAMNLAARALKAKAEIDGPVESWKSVLLRELISNDEVYDYALENAINAFQHENMGNGLLQLNYNNTVSVLCVYNDRYITDLQRSLQSVLRLYKAKQGSGLHGFRGRGLIKAFMTKRNSAKRSRDLVELIKSDGIAAGVYTSIVEHAGMGLLRFQFNALKVEEVIKALEDLGYTTLSTDLSFTNKKKSAIYGGLNQYYAFLENLLTVPGIVELFDNVDHEARAQGPNL